ncbi:MAG: 1,4-beta-glucanase [Oscillospiraceae bacterium]|nr:1,4-beta-glucanase [Oscillospiraceae bacterium]
MKKIVAAVSASAVLCSSLALSSLLSGSNLALAASESIADQTEVGTLGIAGGGFVSGIVTGKNVMYARTDVGGAYKYNYDTGNWDQILDDLNDAERGFLSVDAMCIDPTDDDTIYMLCGCAYFSDAKTEIFRSRDGGKTFDRIDVTDMIQVHGNGAGRQCGEAIAVDPDNPNIIYCGGDVTAGDSALIMSKDGGDTWESVKGYDDLGFFKESIKWPTWTEHMTRALTSSEYASQNGVAIVQILDGKVYVGTSITGEGNIMVADVGSDDFTVLSADLPTEYYPSRINVDADGNLLIAYAGSLTFSGGGALYRYNPKTGEATDITPTAHAYGAVYSDPNDANKLVATSCDFSYSQLWTENAWETDSVVYGSQFFRSTDGGATWESITPGNTKGWGQPLQADYLKDGGRPWIQGYAVHWSGAIVLDPKDPDRFLVTSGNGVFACDNTWDELPVVYFEADGIEEVVALDMISSKGKNPYSVIGDYDGFEHIDKVNSNRYSPTMSDATKDSGSASAIAYCPQNPDVMLRCSEKFGVGYYTLDGGENWVKMDCPVGGKAAITQLEDGSYRFLKSSGENSTAVSYSDDYGATWTSCTGIASAYGSKPTFMAVEESDPSIVYAYATYYNSSWFYSKPEADITDACYKFYVSHDYGATFTEETDIAMYDQCDSAGRIAVLGDGELALGAGWYGAYRVSDYGKTVEKMDVSYCKTMGYGAPEKEGDLNTLYMYGKPQEDDMEGVYRSTDGGETWVAINLHHLYGGTGNGNFLIGDMNEFGTVYMSTVGCGIVYMQSAGGTDPKPTTTTTTATTTETIETTTTLKTTTETGETTTTSSGVVTTTTVTTINNDDLIGDVNVDAKVDLTDAICMNKYLAGQTELGEQAMRNANCNQADGTPTVNEDDGNSLISYIIMLISELPE